MADAEAYMAAVHDCLTRRTVGHIKTARNFRGLCRQNPHPRRRNQPSRLTETDCLPKCWKITIISDPLSNSENIDFVSKIYEKKLQEILNAFQKTVV